jgi:hypothetical protein
MHQNSTTRRDFLRTGLALGASAALGRASLAQETASYPPPLPNSKNGVVSLRTDAFLEVPESVAKASKQEGAAPFTVAKTAPTVELTYHGNLGENAATRRLWSSWGDICVARDGKVYVAIGDHGNDEGGDARCFLYAWDPQGKALTQVVDMNQHIPPQKGQPAWSKVHAKIDEGADGNIYFCCTLNDGNRAVKLKPGSMWTERLPGGQLYQYDPRARRTTTFADLPRPRCTATSLLDRERNVWWCNLEGGAGNDALWCLDLATKKTVYQGPDGSVGFNRNFALGRDGSVYYNGAAGSLWKFDWAKKQPVRLRATFGDSPGFRSSTRESKDGHIYATNHKLGQLLKYAVAKDELTVLGPAWLLGDYVTVAELSPDERFVYYLPGAHGQARNSGTPVIQYDIAANRRKVLAFLAPYMEKEIDYVPAGTYGMKISADGSTLYVNFNGHPTDKYRPKHIRPTGFGLCSFAVIHIPASER